MTSSWVNQAVKATTDLDVRLLVSEGGFRVRSKGTEHRPIKQCLTSCLLYISAFLSGNMILLLLCQNTKNNKKQQNPNISSHTHSCAAFVVCVFVWRGALAWRGVMRPIYRKRCFISPHAHRWLNWPNISESHWCLCSIDAPFCPKPVVLNHFWCFLVSARFYLRPSVVP